MINKTRKGYTIRAVDTDNDTLYSAYDLAKYFGYTSSEDVYRLAGESHVLRLSVENRPGTNKLVFIDTQGIVNVICVSNKPHAVEAREKLALMQVAPTVAPRSDDTALAIFQYNQKTIRTVDIDGEPWWVLKDVCDILAVDNPSYVKARLDDDEVGSFDLPHPQNPDRMLKMVCVNEAGLYEVIIRSDKPEAKPFRRWITHEVIPAIRKRGFYGKITDETLLEMLRERLLMSGNTSPRQSRLTTDKS